MQVVAGSEGDLGDRADSVLGETNRDILLKAVIKKSEFIMKRIDDLNQKFMTDMGRF